MRKLVYFIAVTADGFIAAEDGSFDGFLQDGPQFADLIADFPETFPAPARQALSITAPNQQFDAVLMGRSTYEVGSKLGLTSPYPQLTQYLFSRTLGESPDAAVTLVSSDAAPYVRTLKAKPGRAIWLCGGGKLASALFDEIDELVLKVNPVLFGKGVPLLDRAILPARLRLSERKLYDNGCIRAHYSLR